MDNFYLSEKKIEELSQVHEVQLINYLKATGIEVELLIALENQLILNEEF